MAIKTGRYGRIRMDPTGNGSPGALQTVVSLNAWTASFKTDYEDVTCFNDVNKVYIPGIRDAQGTIGGFWDATERHLYNATLASTPPYIELSPNIQDPIGSPTGIVVFQGLAYVDFDINCGVNAAPKVSGSWRAAGPWALLN